MGYKDYGIFPNHMLLSMGKNLNDLVEDFQNNNVNTKEKKQMLIEAAVQQHQDL